MAYEWDVFLWTADEWIINYFSLPSDGLLAVKLFSIGHALELYLKAANTKINGNIKRAISFSHDIPGIWADCKSKDPDFLPDYELRELVLRRELLDTNDYQKLDKKDLKHFLNNKELYIIAKYLADLKYLGAPLKKIKRAFSIGCIYPNPLWIELFKQLRTYLGHPRRNRIDIIRYHIEQQDIPPRSISYLRDL